MRPLDIRGWCKRHGGDTKAKPKKSKIGKYPGFSKNKEYSVNWRIKWSK